MAITGFFDGESRNLNDSERTLAMFDMRKFSLHSASGWRCRLTEPLDRAA